jgi:hypothetical protein
MAFGKPSAVHMVQYEAYFTDRIQTLEAELAVVDMR